MATKVVLLSCFSGITLLGGCAAVQPRSSFPEVAQGVIDATGYRVHWNSGGADDEAAASQVRTLLSKPLDADAAVQIALLNNRSLQAVYEDLGIAQAELVGAGLLHNPVFDASVRFPEGGSDSPNLDLGVAFEFLDVFFIPLRKRIAEGRLELAKANVSGAVLDLAAETKANFYALQAAEQNVEMRQQVERATAASYDLAQRLRAAGNNRPLDLANERALHEESRLALASAELAATELREQMNRLMGLWGSGTGWMTAGRLPEPTGDEVAGDGLERQAIQTSIDLRASRAELGLSLRTLGITQPLSYLSELEVGAIGERDDGEWEVGPAIALPIPIFSQGQPAVARAQAEIRQAQQRYYATAVEVRSAVREAYARVRSLRQQADHYRSVLLPLRQQIVDETQLQYNAMQIGAFQLLQAKRVQIETGGAYLALLGDYWTAKAQLQLILSGRLTQVAPSNRASTAAMPVGGSSSGGH